ncbi:hypothetical protein E4U59_000020 [Claviceps monticola]|nr:hypothetical protein E4U59_000020 [Claviceps monticola]
MVHDDDDAGEAADDTSGARKPDVRMTRQEHFRQKNSSTSSFTAVPPFTSSKTSTSTSVDT